MQFERETLGYSMKPRLLLALRWDVPLLIPVHDAHLMAKVERKRRLRHLSKVHTPRLSCTEMG